jgi:hypothetical protein
LALTVDEQKFSQFDSLQCAYRMHLSEMRGFKATTIGQHLSTISRFLSGSAGATAAGAVMAMLRPLIEYPVIYFCLALLLLPGAGQATDDPVATYFATLKTFQANFEQTVVDSNLNRPSLTATVNRCSTLKARCGYKSPGVSAGTTGRLTGS